ncbi:hypothetical protein BN1708_007735 [Verticillium longisporum]|uniref:SH3 domain-containing protein n=1 Tax=Verticillium longisporum TaxID=100787 RepID=A0A0G4MVK9_VERLO|nr:hypothetical protein BN1708_007735 [Verticillium longisporum]
MANINQGHNDRSRDPDDCILWTTSGVAPGMQAQDIVSGPMVSGSLTGEKSSFDIALITSRTLGMDKEDMVSGAPPLQFVFETQDTTQGQAAAEDRSCPLDAEMAVGQFSEPFEIEIKDTYGIFQAVGAVYAASPYTAIAADLTRLYDINSLELPPSMEGRGYMTGFGLLSAQRYFPTRVRLLHFGIPERNIQAIAMTERTSTPFSCRHRCFIWFEDRASKDYTWTSSAQYGDSHRDDGFGGPKRSSTWQDDVYDRPSGGGGGGFGGVSRSNTFASRRDDDDGVFSNSRTNSGYGESRTGPGRPTAAKPNFAPKPAQLRQNEAVAVFTFDADQPGDLGFKKGEVITVTKKTDSANDWWTGQIGGRTGIFPSNYVKMKE